MKQLVPLWVAFTLAGCSLLASEANNRWYLLPEPSFMKHEITWPIPGSERAVILPIRATEDEPRPLTLKQTADPSLNLQSLLAEARTNAAALLDQIGHELVRDSRGVIRYAIIASDNPLTASVVHAPNFTDRFLETIGPDSLILIPNRYRVYVFPRSAIPGRELSDINFSDYNATNYPVSREVFEIQNGTLRAVGLLR
jgi:hypothetical protein